ncbi:phosphotransferase enzyme family protein [Podospora appendiculata]|uniref:Phosphotransferase enzyme family protein n=1 Tax=Podospora appendiculata TaxID=314037 RepID=A0AAE0XBC8_9PEZI|nr:phosphotransferase enzyme family protein [Podospora appendiculata]
MNHDGFNARLALVGDILNKYGLETSDISPIEYDADCPFPYNNFIYKVTLTKPAARGCFPDRICTITLQRDDLTALVIRLSNPKAEGLNHANRVQNEVASMHLARKGLQTFKPELFDVIPAVYAWGAPEGDALGWTLMEFKEGVQLDTIFSLLSDADKNDVVEQIADIFSGVQRAPLPESVKSYGGLTIDVDSGEIVTGQMTTLEGGPWNEYADLWKTTLSASLAEAEGSTVLEGWRPSGVREILDAFITSGLQGFLAKSGVDTTLRCLVHGDLTMNNILFNQEAKKITALVDFDFASVLHPAHEFFTSFGDIGGSTAGMRGPDPSEGHLSKAILSGNFDVSDVPEAALNHDVAGMQAVNQLRELNGLLYPFRLAHPMFLKRMTEEQIVEGRKAAEATLKSLLDTLGSK